MLLSLIILQKVLQLNQARIQTGFHHFTENLIGKHLIQVTQ